ncbi:unnamed protein product [Hymenolepis diminuta]|uniref:Uncharacterized protein n=1 Tax=Hymenolepis diminuta TaxID=6216 RepID=A0A564Z606_HYMDI|nr:unnamed protein product [Hymenolepis diminuta]
MDDSDESDDVASSIGILTNLNSLTEIEACASRLDAETTLLMKNLQSGLQRSMYAMMAKCEELVKAMSTVPQLHSLVLQISKALSRLESNLSHS